MGPLMTVSTPPAKMRVVDEVSQYQGIGGEREVVRRVKRRDVLGICSVGGMESIERWLGW